MTLLSLLILTHTARSEQRDDARLKTADHLFARGFVAAARQTYEELLRTGAHRSEVSERLGYLSHLTGHYHEAIGFFDQASNANRKRRVAILAYSVYSHYLVEDYAGALKILKEVESSGYKYETAFFCAEQLQRLTETPPSPPEMRGDRTTVPFESLEPLPVIRVTINSRTVHAFIDTGGPQFAIDPLLAREEHIEVLTEQISRGIGGRRGQKVGFAVIGRLELGGAQLRNVPVTLLPVRGLSEIFGVQIDAVLGTETLARFLPTLDFPRKRLILRAKTEANRQAIRSLKVKARVPFILDDIHSMYAQCRIGGAEPVLLYFDTGLVDDQGAALLTARDRLVDLGVPLPKDSKGGYTDLPTVRVGSLERANVKALYGPGRQVVYCPFLEPYGLIGHNYLKHYSWTIDFDNRMFLFGA